jgi:hypothetical protein
MPELLARIGDQTVPLHDCCWVEYAPCGCPVSFVMAALKDGSHTVATEDDARRRIEPNQRTRDKQIRQGYRLELMTIDRYRAEIDLTVRCTHPQP